MAEIGKASPGFWSMGTTKRQAHGGAHARVGALLHEAQSLLNAGKPAEALGPAREALKLADTAVTRVAVAGLCLVKGDLAEAEANYHKALAHNPRHIIALLGLGQLKLNSGKAQAAIQTLEKALVESPGHADARHLLARAYGLSKRYEDACNLFETLIKEKPQAADIWLGYAHALSNMGRADAAVTAYRRALKLNPDNYRLQLLVAEGFLSVGQVENAEAHFRRCMKLKPDFGPPYHHLARLKRLSNEDLEEARRQLANIPASLPKRVPFLAAIAQMGEQAGEAALTFSALSEALALRRQNRRIQYDEQAVAEKVGRAIEQIGKERSHVLPIARPRPIFIVGMPRSGSTLIEQILACHPEVYASGEWPGILKVANAMDKAGKPYPAGLPRISESEILDLRAIYFKDLEPGAFGKLVMTDKQLGNVLHLPLIEMLFPEALIIRCRRHPMDICWSILTQLFGEQIPFALSPDHISHQMLQHQRMFSAWTEHGTLSTMEVFYEELVENFEKGARELVKFAGLMWDDACLTPQGSSRAVLTASAGQVHGAISKSSVGRWKPFASFLAETCEKLKPLIEVHDSELVKRGISNG
jgi:tetratricopeptide (TPR) repeat protein